MKITGVRLRELTGVMEFEGVFWEERLIRPIDVYPEHKVEGPGTTPREIEPGRYEMVSIFVEIETDEGVTGIGGPIPHDQAYIIDTQFRGIVIGEDPLATERIWDIMYRDAVHGRKGRR